MLKKIVVTLFLGVALAGCSGALENYHAKSFADQLAVKCEAYSGALDALTTLAVQGRLRPSDVNKVEAVRGNLNEICYNMTTTTPTKAIIETVEAGLNLLNGVIKQR